MREVSHALAPIVNRLRTFSAVARSTQRLKVQRFGLAPIDDGENVIHCERAVIPWFAARDTFVAVCNADRFPLPHRDLTALFRSAVVCVQTMLYRPVITVLGTPLTNPFSMILSKRVSPFVASLFLSCARGFSLALTILRIGFSHLAHMLSVASSSFVVVDDLARFARVRLARFRLDLLSASALKFLFDLSSEILMKFDDHSLNFCIIAHAFYSNTCWIMSKIHAHTHTQPTVVQVKYRPARGVGG